MLYVKFNIEAYSKYEDFQKLYDHMVQVRQPGFNFEEEEPEIDWDSMSPKEIDDMVEKISNPPDPEQARYDLLIPDYVKQFYEAFLEFDSTRYGMFGFEPLQVFNYLEFGLEADLTKLQQFDEKTGIIEFAPYGYPYGGMDRLLMTMRAYEFTPIESYNGFDVIEFQWTDDFDYQVTEFPERTQKYKAQMERI